MIERIEVAAKARKESVHTHNDRHKARHKHRKSKQYLLKAHLIIDGRPGVFALYPVATGQYCPAA